jgi:hypothetical protein
MSALVLAVNISGGHFNRSDNYLRGTSVKDVDGDLTVIKSKFTASAIPFFTTFSNEEENWNMKSKNVCFKKGELGLYVIFPFATATESCQPFSNFAPEKVKEIEKIYTNFYAPAKPPSP